MNHLPEWIREKTEPVPEGRYLIGVSGGADSIALLHLFAESPDLSGKTIAAVHVNHGLRGDESDQDEAFVRDICAEMLIPLHVYRIDLNGRHDENAAREARFACFRECMKATGTDTLVLGHHADDLAETFLMRLIRGAGTEGLSCMPPDDTSSGIRIIRPLLSLTRDNIRAALRRIKECLEGRFQQPGSVLSAEQHPHEYTAPPGGFESGGCVSDCPHFTYYFRGQ